MNPLANLFFELASFVPSLLAESRDKLDYLNEIPPHRQTRVFMANKNFATHDVKLYSIGNNLAQAGVAVLDNGATASMIVEALTPYQAYWLLLCSEAAIANKGTRPELGPKRCDVLGEGIAALFVEISKRGRAFAAALASVEGYSATTNHYYKMLVGLQAAA